MKHLHEPIRFLEHSWFLDINSTIWSWRFKRVNTASELPRPFQQRNLLTGKTWLCAEDSLPESEMKAFTGSYTWIPSGERSKGRDISLSEFPKAYPNRSGCSEKPLSLDKRNLKTSIIVKGRTCERCVRWNTGHVLKLQFLINKQTKYLSGKVGLKCFLGHDILVSKRANKHMQSNVAA